ncbi:MAG: hypothetical protein LBU51_07350 [Bacteroidales bacterium]|jgi:hypothetical protein|nr:hypothetical protein [Bacteroidales bacterium]
MKASLITTENIDFLDELFPQFIPQLSKTELVGTISVFSFFFENENLLNDNWESITSSIGSYYQSEFEDEEKEFERWNIYILFIVKEPVSTQLKYKIENDKFSSRKIVQDKMIIFLDKDSIHRLIEEHIINNDLDGSILENHEAYNSKSSYSNNSKIYGLIENSNLTVSGKGTDREGVENLYQQIIKEVENEIQESRNTGI